MKLHDYSGLVVGLLVLLSSIANAQVGDLVLEPTIIVTKPDAATVWTVGHRAVITWNKRGMMAAQVRIGLVPQSRIPGQKRVKPVFRPAHIISPDTPNDGEYSFTVPGVIKPGQYVVVVATSDGKVRTASSGFPVLSSEERLPDLVIVYQSSRPSTYPTGEPAGWHVFVEIRNLNHPAALNCPAHDPCFCVKLQSISQPGWEIGYPLESAEVTTLQETGRVELVINISEKHTIPQPWRIEVDRRNRINESNETNNSIIVDR